MSFLIKMEWDGWNGVGCNGKWWVGLGRLNPYESSTVPAKYLVYNKWTICICWQTQQKNDRREWLSKKGVSLTKHGLKLCGSQQARIVKESMRLKNGMRSSTDLFFLFSYLNLSPQSLSRQKLFFHSTPRFSTDLLSHCLLSSSAPVFSLISSFLLYFPFPSTKLHKDWRRCGQNLKCVIG